jgi:hypothetical protein
MRALIIETDYETKAYYFMVQNAVHKTDSSFCIS